MGIELLGPLRVDGIVMSLQRRDQVVLSALAVQVGEVLSADQLAEALWGETPPASWPKQIHGSVLRLRRALGSAAIETTPAGYRLTVGDDDVDCQRFEELIARGHSLAVDGEFDRAAVAFGRALELWRGAPFDVVDGWSPGRIEAARLDELRLSAEECLLDARLASGEHRDVVAVAEVRVGEQPLREHRWSILGTALYRCGRQADALRALRNARSTLVEQLGIEPGAELVALEQAILAQDESLVAVPAPPSVSEHCPYKGLVPYDVADAEMFFGRDSEITVCVERLQLSPLLVVTGPSGCGKSSLVRAGLIPALERLGHTVVVFVPGVDPQAALTNAVASSAASDPVLVVDQFEELFTFEGSSVEQVRSWCARLAAYATATAPVVVTVRADHVAALAVDDRFAALAERGVHLVKPLTGDPLRRAIEGPAEAAGLRLEAGLVDLLVRDCEGEPGALPLLSHALAETWQRRDGRVLTVEGYRATGEIRGAVARSADRLYESLPAEQRPKLRSMLLRLVAPSPDGEPVRSRVATRSLGGDADRDRVLSLLVRARLVTAEADSVELAHEALARVWPRLRSWLDEDASGQRILRHLATAADGWESLGRPTSELYRGARLEAALEWRTATTPDLTDQETAFLDASVVDAATEREQLANRTRQHARQNRRLRRAITAVAILLVAALVGGVVAYQQRQTAQAQRATAEREERAAALTALTSNAAALRTNRRGLAALLAIEAHRFAPSPATESALLGTFTAAPGLTRAVRTDIQLEAFRSTGGFLPGTDTVAVIDAHGAVHLVDLESGEQRELAALSDGSGESAFDIARDGRSAAALLDALVDEQLDDDQLVDHSLLTVWDLERGDQRFVPVDVPFDARSVSINDDGSLVAVGGGTEGETQVYDGVTGELRTEIDSLGRPEDAFYCCNTQPVVFHPDGSLVVGSMAGPIRLVDPTDGSVSRSIDAPPFTADWSLLLSDDGTTLVTLGSADRSEPVVTVYDLKTDEPIAGPYPIEWCNSLAYAERLGLLLCGKFSGDVKAFDLLTGAEVGRRFDAQQGVVCALITSDDGMSFAEVSGCTSGTATLVEWRLDSSGAVSRLVVDSHDERHLQQYGFAGDDAALVAEFKTDGDETPVTHVLDPSSGEIIDRFPEVYGLIPTDDSNIAVAFGEDGTIGRYDLTLRQPVGRRIDPGHEFEGVWVAGDRVVVNWPTDDGTSSVQAFDLDSGQPVAPAFTTEAFQIWNAAITPEFVYTSGLGLDNEFRVQRRALDTLEPVGEPAIGFSNVATGGGVLIASTDDGQVFEVDPITLEPIGLPFPATNGTISSLALDETGRILMVSGNDEMVRFYDVASRTQLGDPIDTDVWGGVGTALRRDGEQAAMITSQGIVVWDLDPDHWVEAACQLAGRNLTVAEWDQYIGDLAPYRTTCPAYPADATI